MSLYFLPKWRECNNDDNNNKKKRGVGTWSFRKSKTVSYHLWNLRCREARAITSDLVLSSSPCPSEHWKCSEHTLFPNPKKIKALRYKNPYFLDSSLHFIPINLSAFKPINTHLLSIFDSMSIPAHDCSQSMPGIPCLTIFSGMLGCIAEFPVT